MAARFLTINFALFTAMAFSIASAADPQQLEDICVSPNNPNTAVMVNGMWCKNPSEVTADDFLYRGLNVRGSISSYGVDTNVAIIPGLNTLGLTITRVDYSPGGFDPPHLHSRATKVFLLLEGSLYVGFVSFNQSDNSARLFSKLLSPGDVFVFPQGLLHFLFNSGETNATALSVFSSRSPGVTRIASGLFGAQPPISVDLLSKAFQLDAKIVQDLQSMF